MVESYGDSISMAPARGCWRLAHVQTSGGMATLVRSDQQADTQQLILDYVADNSCDVVGLGDTRLGDDPSELTRMARGIQARVAREREEATSTGVVDGNEGRDKREHSDRQSTAAASTAEARSRGTVPGSERTTSSSAVSGVRAASYALDGTVTAPSCSVNTAGEACDAGSVVRSNSNEVIVTHTGMAAVERSLARSRLKSSGRRRDRTKTRTTYGEEVSLLERTERRFRLSINQWTGSSPVVGWGSSSTQGETAVTPVFRQ